MTRVAIAVVGVAVALYGGFLLLSRQDLDQLTNAAVWLVTGVVLHDFVLAPLVIVLFALTARLLPRVGRGPAVVGLVVLGSVTLLAVPVLGRFGARPDNPTLLDRGYGAGWLVLAGLTFLAVLGATLFTTLVRRRRGADLEHADMKG